MYLMSKETFEKWQPELTLCQWGNFMEITTGKQYSCNPKKAFFLKQECSYTTEKRLAKVEHLTYSLGDCYVKV